MGVPGQLIIRVRLGEMSFCCGRVRSTASDGLPGVDMMLVTKALSPVPLW